MAITTLAIDADILVYQVGFSAQQTVEWEDDIATPMASKDDAEDLLAAYLASIYKKFGKDIKLIWCLTDDAGTNFRKKIFPGYKANRKKSSRPLLYRWIREWFGNNGTGVVECWPTLEADDVMGILATRDPECAIVSIDKDMATVPCTLIDPRPGKKWKRTKITQKAANRFHLIQTLTGDRTDNYFGVPGMGPKGAEKALEKGTWGEVIDAYSNKGMSESDALQQARLAFILRESNYKNNVIKLWLPTSSRSEAGYPKNHGR